MPTPKAAEAMRVGRGNLDERDIERHGAALKQFLDFAEIDGRVVGAAVVDGVADVGADEDARCAGSGQPFRAQRRARSPW